MMSAENRRHILPVGRCGLYEVGDVSRDRVSLHAVDGITIAPLTADDKQGKEPHDDF